MEQAILRLFKSYLGERASSVHVEGLSYGLSIPITASEVVLKEAILLYGKDGNKWNQTFHKDFEIVRNAPMRDLILQQVMHYITTYGLESLGMDASSMVYIPREKLEIPSLKEDITLLSILPITVLELQEKLMTLLTSGIALSQQTVKDVMVLSCYIDPNRLEEIQNREVRIFLYDQYHMVPKHPDEFFKYLLFKVTNETLKIQNDQMIDKIQHSDKTFALSLFQTYLKTSYEYEKLSSIFLRNKNLFLAFKIKRKGLEKQVETTNRIEMNAIINKLRKYANKNHQPLNRNLLDGLTDENFIVDVTLLEKELDKVTIFREVRILNGVLYRLYGNQNIVYKIRNGTSYVKKLKDKNPAYVARLEEIVKVVYSHLVQRLSLKVKGKTVYIPEGVIYAVPISEKQFCGAIPFGSCIEIPRDQNFIYGVCWKNITLHSTVGSSFYGEEVTVQEERVDLDLKQMNKTEVFGWDGEYKSSSSDILFSGDMTDASLPQGASELFYVGQNYGYGAFLVTLSMYTCNSEDVPFEFVLAKTHRTFDKRVHYTLDPNEIVEKFDMVLSKDQRHMVMGLLVIGDTIRFYFQDAYAGGKSFGRSSTRNPITMGAFDYLQSYSKIQLKLHDLLKDAGAMIVDKKTVLVPVCDDLGVQTSEMVEKTVDFDLSLSTITKESLVQLFQD